MTIADIEEANAFRTWRDQPMRTCRCGWRAIGPDDARAIQFRYHWQDGCRAVESLSFHPDGSLAGVTFS